jgi:hypothetical protein
MDASYYLASHVHLFVAGTQVVFLDLKRDGYYAVSQGHPVGRWVKGWPQPPSATSPADENDRSTGSESGLLAKMKSQGMLVTDPALGKEATPLITNEPKTALVEHDLNVRPHAKCGQLGRMIAAYLTARWMLKHRPIKVAPLHSQPLIELCLQLPLYVLTSGGWDRAIARQAFRDELPREVANRRHKGGIEQHVQALFDHNRAFLCELLLDGALVREGIVDRAKLAVVLSGKPGHIIQATTYELMTFIAIEVWSRRWLCRDAAAPGALHAA